MRDEQIRQISLLLQIEHQIQHLRLNQSIQCETGSSQTIKRGFVSARGLIRCLLPQIQFVRIRIFQSGRQTNRILSFLSSRHTFPRETFPPFNCSGSAVI